MKRIVENTEADGLESLLGEEVQIWCLNYIYTGKLIGVSEKEVVLDGAKVVYETGKLGEPFKDAQPVNVDEWFIRTSAIESCGRVPE